MADLECSHIVMAEFALLMDQLFKEFCSDPERGYADARFARNFKDVSPVDAADFLFGFQRWIAAAALVSDEAGRYRTVRRGGQWYPFSVASKKSMPVRIAIRTSAILKIATLERLYRDLHWQPARFSHDELWKKVRPFDLLGYDPDTDKRAIACKVRAARTTPQKDGIDDLLEQLQAFGSDPATIPPTPSREEQATVATLNCLRAYRIPYFVAAGPDGYRRLFRMAYRGGGKIAFIEVSEKFFRTKVSPPPPQEAPDAVPAASP